MEQAEIESFLTEKFGTTDVDAIKQKVTGYDELQPKFTQIESELNTIKPEYEKLKEAPAFTELAQFVNKLAMDGADEDVIAERLLLNKIDESKLNDEEAIVKATKMKTKGWTDEHAKAFYKSKFTFDPDDVTVDDVKKTLIEGERIKEAQAAREFLKTQKAGAFNRPVDVVRQQQEQQHKQLTEQWTADAPAIVKQWSELKGETPIKVPGGKGEVEVKAAYAYQIPDKDLQEITKQAIQAAVSSGIPNNDEGKAKVKDYVQRMVNAQYGPVMLQRQAEAIQTAMVNFMQTEFHNPNPIRGTGNGNESKINPSRESGIWKKAKEKQTAG